MPEDSKEIRIRAVLDASQFDKGVNEIQQKLKRMMQQNSMGQSTQSALQGDTLLGTYAKQAFGDFSKESQQQLERMHQAQRKEALDQRINMREKQQAIDKIQKADEALTKSQKDRVKALKEELTLMKERHRETLNAAAETKRALGNLAPDGPGGAVGIGGEAGGAVGAAGGGMRSMLRAIGVGALARGLQNAVVNVIGDVITRERRITEARGGAASSASVELGEQFQGRGSRGMFFARERAEAARMAATEQQRTGMMDLLRVAGGTVTGAAIGAAGGSAVPGIGTAAGGIAGGIAGFGQAMGSERLRARLFDQEKYQALLNKEGMQNFRGNLAALKAQDPRAMLAQQYFEQNAGRMRGMQQMTGMDDQQLLGFMGNQINAGLGAGGVRFNEQMTRQQMSGLQAGGATTRGITGLADFSNILSRQLNLGNSAQTLGQISGAGQSVSETQESMIKILLEAVKRGVDASKMPQEMMRMTAMTARIATQGGAFAPGAVDIAMSGITGLDQAGIQAAGTAAQEFIKLGKQAGGFEGQLGLGFLQSDRAKSILGGKKLSAKDMNYLNQLSAGEVDKDTLQRIASYLNVSSNQVEELLRQKDVYKGSRTSAEEKAYSSLAEYLKSQRGKSPEQIRESLTGGEGGRLVTAAAIERAASRGGQAAPRQQLASVLQQARLRAGVDLGPGGEEQIASALAAPETRAGFLEAGAEATGDLARIQALNDNLKRLGDAAKAHSVHAEEYNKAFELFIEAAERGENATDKLAKRLEELAISLSENFPGLGHQSGDSP